MDFKVGLWGEWERMFENRVHGAFYYPLQLSVRPGPGIYEIRVDDRVVYLGSARNVRRRLCGYQANGSHLALRLSRCLERGCKVDVRWAHTDWGSRAVEKTLLQKIEYPWNRRS